MQYTEYKELNNNNTPKKCGPKIFLVKDVKYQKMSEMSRKVGWDFTKQKMEGSATRRRTLLRFTQQEGLQQLPS